MKQFQSTREKKEGKLHAIGFLSEKLEQLILRILLVFKKRIDKVEYHNHQGLVWPRCHIVAEHIRWNLSFIGRRDGSSGLNRACEFMEILDLLGPPVFFNLKVFGRQAFDRVSSGVGHHHVDYHFLHGRLETHNPDMVSDRRGIRRQILLSCERRPTGSLAARSLSVCYPEACSKSIEVRGDWCWHPPPCRL